jgi:aminoglycoside phosphotransferase family enzyme
MTQPDIVQLLQDIKLTSSGAEPELVETHISWVIQTDLYVYKIKKPISNSFLDFSTPEKRLQYSQCEIRLNWRLTFNMYLEIVDIHLAGGHFTLGGTEGNVIDHAIKMRKQDGKKQMDVLLQKDEVTESDLHLLAQQIARFHRKTSVIGSIDPLSVKEKFLDLIHETDYLREQLGSWSEQIIRTAIHASDRFVTLHENILYDRVTAGFFRDCHGDLHARNIFLLKEPVIFD